jgi:hypothetical protein
MRRLAFLLSAAFLAGCIKIPGAVDEDHLARLQIANSEGFPGLDSSASEKTSLHFEVHAYGGDKAAQIANLAETAFQRITVDTGLASYKPLGGLIELVIYGSALEYHKKTGQPDWSEGVTLGKSIYSYEGGQLDGLLSHELTPLIFYDYIGHINMDHRWVCEGLAVYEESKAGQPASGGVAPPMPRWPFGWQPVSMDFIIHMAPASDRDRATSAWHLQAESMVRFMIERGGNIGFGQFLGDLRQDTAFDKAVADAFPGIWQNLTDFYNSWAAAQQ